MQIEDWYEDQHKYFRAHFSRSALLLEHMPGMFPKFLGDIRRTVLRKFPYNIYYVIEADVVVILAVIYSGRNPKYIHSRLTES